MVIAVGLSRAHSGIGATPVVLQSEVILLQWVVGLQQQQLHRLFELKSEAQHNAQLASRGMCVVCKSKTIVSRRDWKFTCHAHLF